MAAPEDKAARKAAKRAAKKEAGAGGAAKRPAGGDADADAAAERKAAKKARKAEAKAAVSNGKAEAALAPAAAKPAEKPATKPSAPGLMAAVGDKHLAATRPPLHKQLYAESPAVAATSDADVAAWRSERVVTVEGCALRPLATFAQSGLSAAELAATAAFAAPSPIQAQCLPIALSGRDLVGVAATGSGKTLAFGLPALAHARAQAAAGAATGAGPVALVLAPTRELAVQIAVVLEGAGAAAGVRCAVVYGGVPKREQAASLRALGSGALVATPGRLQDLVESRALRLDEVSFLVLDEADRMLDLGFEPAIRALAAATRADRQTLMFSATWPPGVRALAAEFMADPARVTVGIGAGDADAGPTANRAVSQIVEVIDPAARDARLLELLEKYHGGAKGRKNRVLVFVLYKKEAARVEQMLARRGWAAAAVHGDAPQAARARAVDAFRSGEAPLLVATDVAARGLDIPDVEVVLNYSFPLTIEDYVHRIGRTGRAGKAGAAHTFFSVGDKPRAGELVGVLKGAGQPVPAALLAFGTTVKKKESKLYGAHFRDVDPMRKSTKVTFDSDDE
jgi:ATP-dependent RNA helicase DBP3